MTIRNVKAYNKIIKENGEIYTYYDDYIYIEQTRDVYAIYYTIKSIAGDIGTAVLDLTKNELSINYKTETNKYVSGILYSIGNDFYRGTRFLQEPYPWTTFYQLKFLN